MQSCLMQCFVSLVGSKKKLNSKLDIIENKHDIPH